MDKTYVVKSGDTLSKIAGQLGVPISSLTGYRSGDPNKIFPGEVIRTQPSLADRYSSTTPPQTTPTPAAPTQTQNTAPAEEPSGKLTDRYTSEKKSLEENPYYNPQKPDENAIREGRRSSAQAAINAIRATFDRFIEEDTQAKNKMVQKTYFSNLAAGLTASPSGAAREAEVAEKGEAKVRQTKVERDTLIQKALVEADARASEDFATQMSNYLNAAKDKRAEEQKINDKIKTDAESELTAYAQARSFDEWKKEVGPNRVNQYMRETGRDEEGIKAFFLKSIPKDELLSNTGTELSDGSIAFYKKVYDDKGNITGVKEVGKISMPPGKGGKKIKESRITDRGVQVLYDDGTYREIGASDKFSNQEDEDPAVIAELKQAQAAIEAGANPDAVRRAFLGIYPKKANLFLTYTKQEF